jgi:xanthine dehydrogenase accessory factor
MLEPFTRALAWLHSGAPAALAVVVRVKGSAPRHGGAKMVVTGAGEIAGTIGGGRVELEVTRAAAEVAAGGRARVVSHHLVRDLAMCCGGSMEVLIVPLAGREEALEQAIATARERRPFTLHAGIAGEIAIEPGAEGAPRWDGERWREPVWPPERVILFGAGHVARAIGPRAVEVGFQVVVCDDNDTGALDRELPWAAQVIDSFDLYDVRAALGSLGRADFAVVLTRDHAIDQRLVEELIGEVELGYLGLIGSRGKIGRFRRRIVAKGIADEESWARLRAPIGLDIGAETPAEIAVAVVAELIATRAARRRAGDLSGPA